MSSATRARTLIAKLRGGRYKYNPDIMELCRLLAIAMDLGDEDKPPAKPPGELYRKNPTLYMKCYMRWYRWNGQAGNGRDESPL